MLLKPLCVEIGTPAGDDTPVAKNIKETPLWTPGCWMASSNSSSTSENERPSSVEVYNEAITRIASLTSDEPATLTSQLTSTWNDTPTTKKDLYIETARKACMNVCDAIAPNAGEELFSATAYSSQPQVSDDLVALMSAYQLAVTRNAKLQILSIYAHMYPTETLIKLHEPYGKITKWQIKKARAHANANGPGNEVKKIKQNRIRIDRTKLDHFIDFANQPHYYQDVAFGTRNIKLDSGSKLTIPNVIRNVTRSTLISQYMQYCDEQKVMPLSRATLFRILKIREASERKSLHGVDNIAADGSLGFEKLKQIVFEMEELGVGKEWAEITVQKLNSAKVYLKSDYLVHCNEESPCPDHCRCFALSDPSDKLLQESCDHEHLLFCERCEDLKQVISDIEDTIQKNSNKFFSCEQRDDLLYDLKRAKENIFKWKCHVLRSCNQEAAKQKVLSSLGENSALIVIDWAMKFLQLRHREKQCDWYGKKGISWHVSSVITKNDKTAKIEVSTYTHLIDSCSQDWYAVASILENLLKNVCERHPSIKNVYIRSDEAGCYHNNLLIASLKDIGNRVGVKIVSYDYSEPQNGKDICDRILCPMKLTIRRYCNEGHDILSAKDMRKALLEHPVSGVTASVNKVDVSKLSAEVKPTKGFNSFHNFEIEEQGLRVRKAYGIGKGKFIPFSDIVVKKQEQTDIEEDDGFFEFDMRTMKEYKQMVVEDDSDLIECTVPGCKNAFKCFRNLEIHLSAGKHTNTLENETLYDSLRKKWSEKFQTIDIIHKGKQSDASDIFVTSTSHCTAPENKMGWALSKFSSSSRFSTNVRNYLTAKFDIGEQTGCKFNSSDVEADMRKCRNENNERRFSREEWLTSNQIKSFFSRLSAARKKRREMENEKAVDPMEDVDDSEVEIEERVCQVNNVLDQIGIQHPIIYDVYDLCQYYKNDKLRLFNVGMLKSICEHFEIPFKSRDRKSDLIFKVGEMITECQCCSSTDE